MLNFQYKLATLTNTSKEPVINKVTELFRGHLPLFMFIKK